ncbi:MAG: 4Fe-4S dicluster domain-containing protein [Bacteroidetes bacterium]|nr:4Fe-4S dicluster domain-containing protein [Bacteroidota bacterium]
MAIKITEECINCAACEPECPNHAIYEGGAQWSYADGTKLSGSITLMSGSTVDADAKNAALSDSFYYIIVEKCTECKGFHDEPQCASVCPVDCCPKDENHTETDEQLLGKKKFLHAEV